MKTWIFQGNPDRFNIDKYLSQSSKIYWTVTHQKHQNELSLGDLIYLWRAKGLNNAISGIIARGQLIEVCKPRNQVDDPEYLFDNLWQDNNIDTSEIKAGILIHETRLNTEEGMLRSIDLQKDPILSRMQIITARVGSNFLVNDQQSELIKAYWDASNPETSDITEQYISTTEGKISFRMHKFRERDSKLRNKAIESFLDKHKKLFCEVCKFSFVDKYGEIGNGFIEVHHMKPISTFSDGEVTEIENLKLVCSNCHRMIHRGDPEKTFYDLREQLFDA